jgi:hypothetical protein
LLSIKEKTTVFKESLVAVVSGYAKNAQDAGLDTKQKRKQTVSSLIFRSMKLLQKVTRFILPIYPHLSRQHSWMNFSNFLKHAQVFFF